MENSELIKAVCSLRLVHLAAATIRTGFFLGAVATTPVVTVHAGAWLTIELQTQLVQTLNSHLAATGGTATTPAGLVAPGATLAAGGTPAASADQLQLLEGHQLKLVLHLVLKEEALLLNYG